MVKVCLAVDREVVVLVLVLVLVSACFFQFKLRDPVLFEGLS